MDRLANATLLVATALIAAGAAGCLPGDDRPEPGSVLVNVQHSGPAAEGFVTDDGWNVSFERFVMALGGIPLRGDDCVDYSLSVYDRLYDFTSADSSKVALHYGLGSCDVEFYMGRPSNDAILMGGATAVDRDLMNPERAHNFDRDEASGVGLLLKGSAERDGVTKLFFWLMGRSHEIVRCYAPNSEEVLNNVELRGGDAFVRELQIRPQELFRVTPSLTSPIEFGRFAAADSDGDDAITLEELGQVEVSIEEIIEDLRDELPEELRDRIDADTFDEATLEILVTDILSRRVAAFAGAGECEALGLAFGLKR